MKTKIWLASLSAALLMNVAFNPAGSPRLTWLGGATAYAEIRVGIDYFYNELAPYGDWRRSESYGWVWYPEVAGDWRPYTAGHWVFTDDFGWTWVSTEPWGSIPFHYGRWFYDEDYEGWAWVPGTEWGPAWVSWRSGGGFIGWAPLPPSARFEPGVGFVAQGQDFNPGRHSWCFVPTPQFLSPNLRRSILPPPRNAALIDNTVNVTRYTVDDRRVVNRSIDLGRFEQETRKPVVRYRPVDVDRPVMGASPVRGRQVDLFRPQVVGTTAVPPPPHADRAPRRGARPDRSPEHQAPAVAPREYRPGAEEQGRHDRTEPTGPGRSWPDNPDTGEIGKRGGPRPPAEQDRPLQPRMVEPRSVEGQHQPVGQERNGSWEQGRGRQKATDLQQQQMEQEKARQQAILQQQQQQQRQQQAEQEKARQQAILQQQQQQQRQQQMEQEKARQQDMLRLQQQQQHQQAEQERARQQAILQQQQQQQRQQQMEQEKARQQDMLRLQQQQQHQQAEQERARQQAILQQQQQQQRQQQMEQEKARQQDMLRLQQQQQHQQAEQERARQQAILQQQQHQQQMEQQRQQQKPTEPMRRLPDCKSLPPGQQQNCR